MVRICAFLVAFTIPVLVVPSEGEASAVRVERNVQAMGTRLSVKVEAFGRPEALAASEAAIAAVAAAERRLSTWDPSSELSRVNDNGPGVAMSVSPELVRDLIAARTWSQATSGAFSPGTGALVRAWGLRTGGRRATDAEIGAALEAIDIGNLEIEPGQIRRLHDNFIVEEGAFGKGAGLDDAAAALARTGATGAVLDLGGQITVWGESHATIGIADPRQRDRVVLELRLTSGSVATSGNSERGIVVDGHRLGHILDPRTGRPSPEFGSVTVWTQSSLASDCLSTGLYVLGADNASDWAAARDDVAVVVLEVLDDKLQAHASESLRDRLRVVTEDVALRWR